MKLTNYNNCIFCGSAKLNLKNNQNFIHNFYTKSISNDLKLSKNFFNQMKVYECERCYLLQNNPWFSRKTSFKIFNEIYGQHNRNWQNIINFFKKSIKPDHGKLFKLLNNNLNIKRYGEFNSPFMGLMIDFFSHEYKKNSIFYEKFFEYSIKYLSSRQVAGLSVVERDKKQLEAKKYLVLLNNIKKKNFVKKKVTKSLIIDNSHLGWLYNDNYKSVNSRSLASKVFDIQIQDFNLIEKSNKYDLFGIFHTLDHTHQPKKILDFALNNSKYVMIYCHIDENLEKQHLFSFTNKFIYYFKKKKIFFKDLTLHINKNFKSKELYLICSKYKKINIKI